MTPLFWSLVFAVMTTHDDFAANHNVGRAVVDFA